MTLHPPAKINLTLDVGPIRPDGYHEIDTVFQTVSLHDELEIELGEGPALPPDDLVTRALEALDPSARWSVRSEKRIPPRAGLAGGSADAAAALIGGARLLGSEDRHLAALALELGSDVTFFLLGGAARGRGRGERLDPLPDLPAMWFALAMPAEGVSTPEAFGLLDSATDRRPGRATARLVEAWGGIESPQSLAPFLSNDFQPVIEQARPDVAALAWEVREAGAIAVVLCGSGSVVAGLCDSEEEARRVCAALPGAAWAAAVRTLGRAEWP